MTKASIVSGPLTEKQQKDIVEYDEYLAWMAEFQPMLTPMSFSEMFGYEIIMPLPDMEDTVIMFGIGPTGVRIRITEQSWCGWFGSDPSEWPELLIDTRIELGTMRYYDVSRVILISEEENLPHFLFFIGGMTDETLELACRRALYRIQNYIETLTRLL